MADQDLATLWSFAGGLRCLLTPVDGRWQVRIEDGYHGTVRSCVTRTSDEAITIADRWLRDCVEERSLLTCPS